jgi:hypothetical protein
LGSGDVASKDWTNVDSQREPEIDIGGNILDRAPWAGYSIHMEHRLQYLRISDVVDMRVALRVHARWRTAPLLASPKGDSTEWEGFHIETFKSNRFVGG